jgi:membrane protein DedA with SNARE-associated domain
MMGFYESFGYLAVFGVLLLCGFGLPVPEDISIIAGGIISGLGYANVHVMCVVSLAGVLIGDCIIFYLGRHFGKKILKKRLGKKIEGGWYDRILRSFRKNGKMVLFAARFIPVLRTPIFLTAGITHFVGFGTFLLIDGIAALLSVPVWTYLGYFCANLYYEQRFDKVNKLKEDTMIVIFIALGVIILIYLISKYFKKKLIKAEIVNGDKGKL